MHKHWILRDCLFLQSFSLTVIEVLNMAIKMINFLMWPICQMSVWSLWKKVTMLIFLHSLPQIYSPYFPSLLWTWVSNPYISQATSSLVLGGFGQLWEIRCVFIPAVSLFCALKPWHWRRSSLCTYSLSQAVPPPGLQQQPSVILCPACAPKILEVVRAAAVTSLWYLSSFL